jgi:hypothetical protein
MNIKRNSHERGNIVLSIMFALFFSLLGLSLIFFCITHTQIVRARNTKLTESNILYQDFVYYLHQFRERVFEGNIQDYEQPGLDFFNISNFPIATMNNPSYQGYRQYVEPFFNNTDYTNSWGKLSRVKATFSCYSQDHPYRLKGEVIIDILSGRIPLEAFPFFLNRDVGMPVESFLEANRVKNNSLRKPLVQKIDTELNYSRFLLDALKISGAPLSWNTIRDKCGLSPSDTPIPEGLHLALMNETVQSIVIKGNVEQMIFSVDNVNHRQNIKIIMDSIPYKISYTPGKAIFSCWETTLSENCGFKEILMVIGNVQSIRQEGDAAFLEDSSLTLYVSGAASIVSCLESEARLHLGTRKFPLSNLRISCGKDKITEQIFDAGGEPSGISVDTEEKVTLDASLITSGKFLNSSRELILTGGVYCHEFENNGTMDVRRNWLAGLMPWLEDFCTTDFKYISQYFISSIEEVFDEK